MKPGQSIEYRDCRIKYDPDWSPSMPYLTYYNGTAGRCFGSVQAAMQYLGIPAHLWSEPY